jgi:hypothetical protein
LIAVAIDPEDPGQASGIAWEAPGSSAESAAAVGGGATLGAIAAVLAANLPLPLPGLEPYAWAILPAVAGVGAAIGAWLGWALFGKT